MNVRPMFCWIVVALFGSVMVEGITQHASAQTALERLEKQLQGIKLPPGLGSEKTPDEAKPTTKKKAPEKAAKKSAAGKAYLGVTADDKGEAGRGVRVLRIHAGAPGDRGGLRAGDLITHVDRQRIHNMNDLGKQLKKVRPGQKIVFQVNRRNINYALNVVAGTQGAAANAPAVVRPRPVETLPEPRVATRPAPAVQPPAPRRMLLGVRSSPIDPVTQRALRMTSNRGALVTSVVLDSPADRAGIRAGTVIISINGRLVASPADLSALVAQSGEGSVVVVGDYFGGRITSRTLRLAGAPAPVISPRAIPRAREFAKPIVNDSTRVLELERQVRTLEQRIERLEQALRAKSRP